MAMDKFRPLDEEEERIVRRNGIDPEGMSVTYRTTDLICLIRHKTRDEITIRQGERKWPTYG